jgi:DnaJ domain
MQRDKFHGRIKGKPHPCAHPGCPEPGEFRAPNPYGRRAGFDGPGEYQWLCLDHVREFNARYDFFTGMSREEIEAAQMPAAAWERSTNRIYHEGGVDTPPKWADFHDPLDAISARFKSRMAEAMPAKGSNGYSLTPEDRRALKTLGLAEDADRMAIRARYSERVREYHPDKNGGDRRFEKKLQAVVEAYQLLKASGVAR